MSHFEPSDTKISSAATLAPRLAKSCLAMASRRKSKPCSGPYPRKVERFPISSTALCIASVQAAGSGSVTSPIPMRMIFALGFSAANFATRRPISGKRYPALSFE